MKKIIPLVITALLVGCVSAPRERQIETPKIHPSWPAPIRPFQTTWTVIDVSGTTMVAIPYKESQDLRIWLEDIKRYMIQANNLICYYRSDLNELKCKENL